MAKRKVQKFQSAIKILLCIQTIMAFLVVLYFLIIADPMLIGIGQFESVVHKIESIDYRWWLLTGSILFLLLSLASTILFYVIDLSGFEISQIKDSIYSLVKGKNIPVRVDVDEKIRVEIEEEVSADFSVNTTLNISESVHIQTTIPVDLNLPIDTVFETKVLGIGTIKIPIKTSIPVKMDFPFDGYVKLNMQDFNLVLNEKAHVKLPPMMVPIKCQIDAVLNLESNLKKVEKTLFKSDS